MSHSQDKSIADIDVLIKKYRDSCYGNGSKQTKVAFHKLDLNSRACALSYNLLAHARCL